MNATLPPPDAGNFVPPAQPTTVAETPRPDCRERLLRPQEGRRIGGVCAAIAQRYNWDPTTVRVVAVLSILLPGPQVLAYLAGWIIIPSGD